MTDDKNASVGAAGNVKKPEGAQNTAGNTSANANGPVVQPGFFGRFTNIFTRFFRYLRSWLPF